MKAQELRQIAEKELEKRKAEKNIEIFYEKIIKRCTSFAKKGKSSCEIALRLIVDSDEAYGLTNDRHYSGNSGGAFFAYDNLAKDDEQGLKMLFEKLREDGFTTYKVKDDDWCWIVVEW